MIYSFNCLIKIKCVLICIHILCLPWYLSQQSGFSYRLWKWFRWFFMWCQKSNFEDIGNHLVPNTIPYTHTNTHIHSMIMCARHPKTVGKHINMQKEKSRKGVGWLIQQCWQSIFRLCYYPFYKKKKRISHTDFLLIMVTFIVKTAIYIWKQAVLTTMQNCALHGSNLLSHKLLGKIKLFLKFNKLWLIDVVVSVCVCWC